MSILIFLVLLAFMLLLVSMIALYEKWKKLADKWANYALDAQEQLAGDSEGKSEFDSMISEYDKDFNSTINQF